MRHARGARIINNYSTSARWIANEVHSAELALIISYPTRQSGIIREIKFDVYGKRQTAKMKLLPSVFSSLYSRIKIFVFAVNSKRHFSIFLSLI